MVNKVVEDRVLDRTYAALADPTRRALLVALRAGAARITDLAEPLPISFAAVSRHVGVLEAAGLIHREKQGREHWLSVQPGGLQQAERWIIEQASFWTQSADALAERLERKRMQAQDAPPGEPAGEAPGEPSGSRRAACGRPGDSG